MATQSFQSQMFLKRTGLPWPGSEGERPRLRSAVGKREVERRRRAAHSATKLKRNAARRAADGSRRSCGYRTNVARDERAVLRSGTGVVERGTGPTGSPWSGAKRALVTAVSTNVVPAPIRRAECKFGASLAALNGA